MMDRCSGGWLADLWKTPAIPNSKYSLPGGFFKLARPANMPTFSKGKIHTLGSPRFAGNARAAHLRENINRFRIQASRSP